MCDSLPNNRSPSDSDDELHLGEDTTDSTATSPQAPERLKTLVLCASLMLTVGGVYAFAAFSARLGELMEFDSTDINMVGTSYNLGTWFAVAGGLVADRYGPVRCIRLGALLCAVGNIAAAIACTKRIPHSALAFATYAFLFAQGSGWGYLAGMKVALKSFHSADHGSVVGTMVCFVALSAGVISQTYKCLFATSELQLFYLASLVLCCGIQLNAAQHFDDEVPCAPPRMCTGERRCLNHLVVLIFGLSIWLLFMSLLQARVTLPQAGQILLFLVVAAHIAGLPTLWFWWRSWGGESFSIPSEHAVPVAATGLEVPQSPELELSEAHSRATFGESGSRTSESVAALSGAALLLHALTTADFWLLVTAVACSLSFPVTQLNNVSLLAQALRTDVAAGSATLDSTQIRTMASSCVALFSVGNAWGRLFTGFVADRYSLGAPRWTWFLLSCGIATFANIVLLVHFEMFTLYVSVPLSGFALGSVFSVSPVAVSDMYSRRNFATVWSVVTVAPCITTELLGTLLAGHVADRGAATAAFSEGGHLYCLGRQCFFLTFVVTLAVEAAAIVSSFVLLKRLSARQLAQ